MKIHSNNNYQPESIMAITKACFGLFLKYDVITVLKIVCVQMSSKL